jgi:hypothetical protein
MKVDRKKAMVLPLKDIGDDEYVDASPAARIGMVWDITVQLWSIAKKGKIHAQSRLQRHVATLKKI